MWDTIESGCAAISGVMLEIVHSPLNICLLSICLYLAYKMLRPSKDDDNVTLAPPTPQLPMMKKRDMTVNELRAYDGTGPEGRILIAVNGKIFDVTRTGKRFYGPGGPYSTFGGRDASRGLATFSVDMVKDEYDDLSDLNMMQMESVKEWEQQFTEKYDFIGRLLKPGEEPTEYSDEEDSPSQSDTQSDPSKTESSPEKSKDE